MASDRWKDGAENTQHISLSSADFCGMRRSLIMTLAFDYTTRFLYCSPSSKILSISAVTLGRVCSPLVLAHGRSRHNTCGTKPSGLFFYFLYFFKLLQHKKKSIRRYDTSVVNYSLIEDNSALNEIDETRNTNRNLDLSTMASEQAITIDTLNTCTLNTQSLLSNIENLQVLCQRHNTTHVVALVPKSGLECYDRNSSIILR